MCQNGHSSFKQGNNSIVNRPSPNETIELWAVNEIKIAGWVDVIGLGYYIRPMRPYGYRAGEEQRGIVEKLRKRKLPIMLLVIFVVVLLVTFSNKGLLRRFLLEDELREREQRISQIKSEIEALKVSRLRLEREPSAIEHVAREVHGMVRPGEVVYKVQRATAPDKQ
jgi:cell division protein FtsB